MDDLTRAYQKLLDLDRQLRAMGMPMIEDYPDAEDMWEEDLAEWLAHKPLRHGPRVIHDARPTCPGGTR